MRFIFLQSVVYCRLRQEYILLYVFPFPFRGECIDIFSTYYIKMLYVDWIISVNYF